MKLSKKYHLDVKVKMGKFQKQSNAVLQHFPATWKRMALVETTISRDTQKVKD